MALLQSSEHADNQRGVARLMGSAALLEQVLDGCHIGEDGVLVAGPLLQAVPERDAVLLALLDHRGSLRGAEVLRLEGYQGTLPPLPALRQLTLRGGCSEEALRAAAGLATLTALDLSGASTLASLPDLGALVGLQKLSLAGCAALKDLRSLAGLTALVSLDLTGCDSVTDLSPLAGLDDLELVSSDRLQRLHRRQRQRKRRVGWAEDTRRRKKRRSRKRNQKR